MADRVCVHTKLVPDLTRLADLRPDEVTTIVDLMVKRVAGQLADQGIGLEISEAAKLHLADVGYDPTLGARPLRRAIQRHIEDALSERLLWKEFRAGQTIMVDVEPDPDSVKGENRITFLAAEGFEPPAVEMAVEGSE